jgi:2-desacetyl-2-hydroxyethyl bacteriochlorophyllide A dehydrogenase
MKAKAIHFVAPRRIEVVPVDLPVRAPNSLVVRTLFSGISGGTEMLAYRGEIDQSTVLDETLGSLSGTFRYPFPYGYSCVGPVEHGTERVPPGSLVFAFSPHQDRFVVDESDVVPLDDDTDPRDATLFPLVETALQITLDAGPLLEETVVLTGLGVVGLLTALLLQRSGASVVACEPQDWRRDVAQSLGVPAVAPEGLRDVVAEATGGRGAGLLVELSGAPEALVSCLGLLRHEGTALVGSWYGTREVSLPLGAEFHRRRLTIRSSQVSTIPAAQRSAWDIRRRRRAALRLMRELPVSRLNTTEFAFAEAAPAYACVDRAEPGVLHVVLRYE